jgi:hypothetical protein
MPFTIRFDKSDLGDLFRRPGVAIARIREAVKQDVDTITLDLQGKVEANALAREKVGATGVYSNSITSEKAELVGKSTVRGAVVIGKGGEDVQHAKFVEYGTKPHKARKGAGFWIRVLQPYVHLKDGIRLMPGKTIEAQEKSTAVAMGRGIEKRGTKPGNVVGEVYERDGPAALDRLAELVSRRLDEAA